MESLVYVDRHGSNCVKWDILGRKYGNPDLLSMWIADMDFRAPECVLQALKKFVEDGVFGYYLPPRSGQQAFIDWEQRRYDFRVEPEWLRFAPGAVSAMRFCLSALTEKGDAVAVLTPVYPAFLSTVEGLEREVVRCPLVNDGGRYSIDFAAMEALFVQHQVRLLMFCAPHNPVGRVWTEEELQTLLELCRKYRVQILSDEVHQDLCQPGHRHIPLAKLAGPEDQVVCITGPGKTFNLAGCRTATIILPNEGQRKKVDAVLEQFEISRSSSYSYVAAEAAYSGGESWLNTVLEQVKKNDAFVREALQKAAPQIVIAPLEGTFLMWLDFSRLIPKEEFHDFVEKECGLALNYGESFGDPCYQCFVRMNIATSFENVQLAVEKILAALAQRGLTDGAVNDQ